MDTFKYLASANYSGQVSARLILAPVKKNAGKQGVSI